MFQTLNLDVLLSTILNQVVNIYCIYGIFQGFETNSVAFFMMSTNKSFGDLSFLRIWHDNSGDGNTNSWYLHKIVVTDIHTDAR